MEPTPQNTAWHIAAGSQAPGRKAAGAFRRPPLLQRPPPAWPACTRVEPQQFKPAAVQFAPDRVMHSAAYSPSASLALGQVSPTLACELASRAPTSHIEPAPAAVHLQAWGSAGSACLVPPQAGRKLGEPARRGHQAMSCQSPSIKAERAAVFQTTAGVSPTVERKPGRGPLLYGGMRVQAPWECTVTLYYCSINRITGEESHTPARSQASCTERSRLTHLVKSWVPRHFIAAQEGLRRRTGV